MTKAETITAQKKERDSLLKNILESKAPRKIIVAGAGTGKTYTFSEILKQNHDGANIAMTFIRLLRNDMAGALGDHAEVRTFHEFCKKILHERRGGFFLYPKLTDIIKEDATHLSADCESFDEKFSKLDLTGSEIAFYLKRGDYYNTVSFNDSVYRMLLEIQKDSSILDTYNQILIDEFQDFNPLEVAFINELEKKGNILIVGDDDQAVYDTRFSTPDHLRDKFKSGRYEIFELPFCSRCTEAIVNSTNAILKFVEENDGLQGRLPKRYECFIELKDDENIKYPKITTAKCTNVPTVIKFIKNKISKISPDEISESWQKGKEYPTILIVGAKQYLNAIHKTLKNYFVNIKTKQSEKNEVTICDGYDFLFQDIKSNLGWRIIIDFLFTNKEVKNIVEKSNLGTPIADLLSRDFISAQTKIINVISKFNKKGQDINTLLGKLKSLVGQTLFTEIKARYLDTKEEEGEPDKTQPSILLTSFQGCKGISGGFVFIVGANNGVFPRGNTISDVEICQFIVALTRTRKKCYILSEDRMYMPKDKNGKWIPKQDRSAFIDMIPESYMEDLGNLKAGDIHL